ncbi:MULTISPECIES: FAD-dependent monooxygenase [unclassified Streptomyces]|uniref:FAD-dependent monooxygenase n=1 Tax=unclassified Streptomyces TaxID=2593676 RepID=UPI0003784C9D|nr:MULTISPECIES: FAD-dependent monooxygenase [unclassified Streptomyces]MYY01866.1 FAD-binding protein [Streptomyces sp. SID4913]
MQGQSAQRDTDVVVAGAGPAGLMLAAELRLAGAEVVVLEQESRPTAESRGMGFTARTLEVFDQRGLLPRFGELKRSPGGHFGSVPVDFAVGDGRHASVTGISQARTVAALGEWAAELGADIRRGHRLTRFTDNGDRVEVWADGPDGEVGLTASYLVGCDGGRSTVRRAGGFDFPGTDATAELLLADVKDLRLPPKWSGERRPGGMLLAAPLGGGMVRIVVSEHGRAPRERTGPPAFSEVADAWKRVSGDDITGATPVWVSSFGDAARQASEYRKGRVMLAGDAAHVHLPASGQGMNVSIQDAVNLGWKLGAVVTGRVPGTLLDSYHAERHPVGAELLRNTRAQASLFLGGPEMQPLRDVLTQVFGGEEAALLLAGLVSGLEIRYDVGPGDHPLLGRRLPDIPLVLDDGEKTRSTRLLHPARGVLLSLGTDPAPARTAARWAPRVDVVRAARPHATGPAGETVDADAVLVRPDGYVAWVAGSGDLSTALHHCFGEPTG